MENAFNYTPKEEYTLKKIDYQEKKDLIPEAIVIINLEPEDFPEYLRAKAKYTQGSQLIFVHKSWFETNTTTVGLMYPNSIIANVSSLHAVNFNGEELATKLQTLLNTHYIILPLRYLKFKGKSLVSFSSISICKSRYRLRSNGYIMQENSIVINYRDLQVQSVFLQGVAITQEYLGIMLTKLKLNLPSTAVLDIFVNSIQNFSTDPSRKDRYRSYQSFLGFYSAKQRLSDSITRQDSHWLFNTAQQKQSYYKYVSIFSLLWILNHELSLLNVYHTDEIGEGS